MVDRFSFWLSCRNLFQGAKSIFVQTSIVFGPKFQKGGGGGAQKSLHLSGGLLRNRTDVKWHSVGSTMTSIAGEVTQTYS